MNECSLTGDQLRAAAFAAIRRELGPAALVRFIAENLSQPGRDYTAERRGQEQPSLDEIFAEVERLKAQQGGSLAPPDAKIVENRDCE